MAKTEKKTKFLAIRSLFVQGSITRMKDLEELYPTAIAKKLQINHSRYIEKLYKPDGFSIKQVKELASLLDLDPRVIFEVIISQPVSNSPTRKKKN
jgi:hypothetical protein